MRRLTEFLKEQDKPEVTIIVNSIVTSGIEIYKKLKLIGINNFYSESEEKINTSGDKPKKIDIYAHHLLINNLKNTKLVKKIGSEESEEVKVCDNFISNKVYDVYFDPIDGSSNLECSGGTGTIFGIFPSLLSKDTQTFPFGKEIICAGYLYYSSSLVLTITFGKGTFMFTYDGQNFVENSKSPVSISNISQKIYSINEGSQNKWNQDLKDKIQKFKEENYSLRYIGSMVADVHRTLLYGGVFIHPTSKLRLLYECFPMAFLIESAGGVAFSGDQRILDLTPPSLHYKTPIILGCKEDIL